MHTLYAKQQTVRQRENFLVLMSNWNKVLEAQTVATKSSGLATQRYKIYLEGLEAATNRFTVAWEKLWADTINSKSIRDTINLGTAILGLADSIGLLEIALIAIGNVIAFKTLSGNGITTIINGVKGLTTAVVSLKSAMSGTAAVTGAEAGLAGSLGLVGGWIGLWPAF